MQIYQTQVFFEHYNISVTSEVMSVKSSFQNAAAQLCTSYISVPQDNTALDLTSYEAVLCNMCLFP